MNFRKGISIGKAFGIKIRLHYTFLWFLSILLLMELLTPIPFKLKIIRIFYDLLFFVIIFGSVILHELGHSLVAMHFNINVKEIILLPIGGVAELLYLPKNPKREFLIAIAGPMVNIIIILISLSILLLFKSLSINNYLLYYILIYTIKINGIMFLFNLLPVFPLDGGRIYRSYLTKKYGFLEATEKAAKLGKRISILLLIISVLQIFHIIDVWEGFNIFTIIIAIFLYTSADMELNFVKMRLSQSLQIQELIKLVMENPNMIIFLEDEIRKILSEGRRI